MKSLLKATSTMAVMMCSAGIMQAFAQDGECEARGNSDTMMVIAQPKTSGAKNILMKNSNEPASCGVKFVLKQVSAAKTFAGGGYYRLSQATPNYEYSVDGRDTISYVAAGNLYRKSLNTGNERLMYPAITRKSSTGATRTETIKDVAAFAGRKTYGFGQNTWLQEYILMNTVNKDAAGKVISDVTKLMWDNGYNLPHEPCYVNISGSPTNFKRIAATTIGIYDMNGPVTYGIIYGITTDNKVWKYDSRTPKFTVPDVAFAPTASTIGCPQTLFYQDASGKQQKLTGTFSFVSMYDIAVAATCYYNDFSTFAIVAHVKNSATGKKHAVVIEYNKCPDLAGSMYELPSTVVLGEKSNVGYNTSFGVAVTDENKKLYLAPKDARTCWQIFSDKYYYDINTQHTMDTD